MRGGGGADACVWRGVAPCPHGRQVTPCDLRLASSTTAATCGRARGSAQPHPAARRRAQRQPGLSPRLRIAHQVLAAVIHRGGVHARARRIWAASRRWVHMHAWHACSALAAMLLGHPLGLRRSGRLALDPAADPGPFSDTEFTGLGVQV